MSKLSEGRKKARMEASTYEADTGIQRLWSRKQLSVLAVFFAFSNRSKKFNRKERKMMQRDPMLLSDGFPCRCRVVLF